MRQTRALLMPFWQLRVRSQGCLLVLPCGVLTGSTTSRLRQRRYDAMTGKDVSSSSLLILLASVAIACQIY